MEPDSYSYSSGDVSVECIKFKENGKNKLYLQVDVWHENGFLDQDSTIELFEWLKEQLKHIQE